jgi:small subunit ribosomal protein S17e
VDRIKRLSYEVLDEHKSQFGEDFTDNKKVLDQISIIRSKSLKNKIAGYITRFIKKEIREEKTKQAQIASSQSEELIEEDVQAEIPEPTTISKETSTEILVETSPVEEKTETVEEKTETVEEKTETVEEKTETVEEKTETVEEKTE